MSDPRYADPLQGLSARERADLSKMLDVVLQHRPQSTQLATLPRQQVGTDPSGFVNSNAQMWRDVSDRHNLTSDLEDLFAQGKTATQVQTALGDKLKFLGAEDRGQFVVAVRATLGIPSRADAEGIREFDRWLNERQARLAAPQAAEAASTPNALAALTDGRPALGEAVERLQGLQQAAEEGDQVAAYMLKGLRAELAQAAAPSGAKISAEIQADQVAEQIAERAAERDERREEREAAVDNSDAAGSNTVEPEEIGFAANKNRDVPEHVENAYGRKGKRFLDPDNPRRTAFVDHGDRLTTNKAFDPSAVRSMVDIAEARGWTSIKISGDQDFRRAVWMEAAKRGIEAAGYKPTDAERKVAEKAAGKQPTANGIAENELVKAYRGATTDEARVAAAKKHPSLTQTFALEAALTKFADAKFAPADAKRFIDHTRKNILNDLAAGVAHGPVNIRQPRQQQRTQTRQSEAEV